MEGGRWRIPQVINAKTRATEIRNPKSEIPNPKSQIPNPKSQIPNPKSEIPNPKSQIPNPRSQIPDPKSQIPNPAPLAALVQLRIILPTAISRSSVTREEFRDVGLA